MTYNEWWNESFAEEWIVQCHKTELRRAYMAGRRSRESEIERMREQIQQAIDVIPSEATEEQILIEKYLINALYKIGGGCHRTAHGKEN